MFTLVVNICRDLCRRLSNVSIIYVPRRDNAVADSLAKEARKSDEEVNVTRTFPHPPSYTINNFVADCNNFIFTTI